MILIFGASSRIGGHFLKKFTQEKFEVLGTYCNNQKQNMIHFDLETNVLGDLELKNKPTHAIITAAANPRPELSKNSNDFYEINVTKTKNLIEDCFEQEIIPIYISSDNVFDGKKGNYKEEDKTNPLNNYGKIKCEIENYLFNSDNSYILLRMGKVFGIKEDDTLFLKIKNKLLSQKSVSYSLDQKFTPCYAEDLYDFTKLIINNNYKGTFHLGSTLPITRYEVATKTKDILNIKAQIIPCKINEIGLSEKRPLKIDLNLDKYKTLTGKNPRSIEYFLKKFI